MNRDVLTKQIQVYEDEFIRFMGIKEFPVYELQTKEASKDVADDQGYEVVACTFYQPQIQKHTLCVSTNLILSKYLLFHEFTHILDSEMYVKGDKVRYAGLSGFTEYHASQVELAQLLGANTIEEIPQFSMNFIVTTLAGEKSVYQYVEEKHQHAIELFNRVDFPADINTLKSAFGVFFNYLGLRSICEMYSIDYTEIVNNEAFLKFIPTQYFSALNNLMHGWLDNMKIDQSSSIYANIVFPLIKEFKLV